jgi:hypothetical protein
VEEKRNIQWPQQRNGFQFPETAVINRIHPRIFAAESVRPGERCEQRRNWWSIITNIELAEVSRS